MTLRNLKDTLGVPVTDGSRIAFTAANTSNPNGYCCTGSAGESLSGPSAPNNGNYVVHALSAGVISFTFTAPSSNNVTSVIAAVQADVNGNVRKVGRLAFVQEQKLDTQLVFTPAVAGTRPRLRTGGGQRPRDRRGFSAGAAGPADETHGCRPG